MAPHGVTYRMPAARNLKLKIAICPKASAAPFSGAWIPPISKRPQPGERNNKGRRDLLGLQRADARWIGVLGSPKVSRQPRDDRACANCRAPRKQRGVEGIDI